MIDISSVLSGETLQAEPAPPCAGAVCDSRRAFPGCAFVAIQGTSRNGAAFAAEAAARGASCIVCETPPGVPGTRTIRVRNARRAWALLASAQAGDPTASMDVWGVTGTNGKTTTAWTLAEMFAPSGGAGIVTTVESGPPGALRPSAHTTPDAGTLHPLFASMLSAGCRRAVMEVSSHSVSQRRIDGIRFAGCVFTNLSEDHLDYHRTMENYFLAKAAFFERAAERNPGAPAVVCGSGEWSTRALAAAERAGLRTIRCGIGEGFDVSASGLLVSADGNDFTLCASGREQRVHCPLAGRYNAENVLCSAAAALAAGVAFESVCETIGTLAPRWGRLEKVQTASAADVFVDFAHTDDALAKVLSAVRAFTRGRVWVVFGAGGDRDRAKRPLMGAACARFADRIVVTSDNPRSEEPMAIIEEIMQGIPAGTNAAAEPDRAKAIAIALAGACKGDTVVIAGKGHETVQIAKGVETPFDDRATAAAWRP